MLLLLGAPHLPYLGRCGIPQSDAICTESLCGADTPVYRFDFVSCRAGALARVFNSRKAANGGGEGLQALETDSKQPGLQPREFPLPNLKFGTRN